MKRHRTGGAAFGVLLLVLLLSGQMAAMFHHHGDLVSRRNCPVCVQSAHESAVPGTVFRVAFEARPETALPERNDDPAIAVAPAPADARSPPLPA